MGKDSIVCSEGVLKSVFRGYVTIGRRVLRLRGCVMMRGCVTIERVCCVKGVTCFRSAHSRCVSC